MRSTLKSVMLTGAFLLAGANAFASTLTLATPAAGDAMYAWNSKYGAYGYTTETDAMGVGLYFGAPYGNDYTVSIFEIPIAALVGQAVTSATLEVYSQGFGTGYYYGSANIGWLDVANASGNVVTDALGPASTARPNQMTIWNSDWGTDSSGLQTFDVLSYVLQDLSLGRTYSTFVMSGSRDTWGSISTGETSNGPHIVATTDSGPSPVPVPPAVLLFGSGLTALAAARRNKK